MPSFLIIFPQCKYITFIFIPNCLPLPTPHSPLPTPHSPLPTPHSPLSLYTPLHPYFFHHSFFHPVPLFPLSCNSVRPWVFAFCILNTNSEVANHSACDHPLCKRHWYTHLPRGDQSCNQGSHFTCYVCVCVCCACVSVCMCVFVCLFVCT